MDKVAEILFHEDNSRQVYSIDAELAAMNSDEDESDGQQYEDLNTGRYCTDHDEEMKDGIDLNIYDADWTLRPSRYASLAGSHQHQSQPLPVIGEFVEGDMIDDMVIDAIRDRVIVDTSMRSEITISWDQLQEWNHYLENQIDSADDGE